MDKFSIALILILIIVLLWWYYTAPAYTPIVINGRVWNVISDYSNAREAAQLMSDMHDQMLKFMKYMIVKYKIDSSPPKIPTDPKLKNQYMIVSNLVKNYNPDEFYENDPRISSDTSYVKDKGRELYVCLRTKKNPNQLVGMDILIFVMLHELAHIGNYSEFGHGQLYWQIFKFFLQEAQKAGVYHPIDYKYQPTNYCGLDVSYNPYYDDHVANIFG